MTIGEKIKQAIENSRFSGAEVASHAEMTRENLYKIYKRDSVESRYLVKISEKLGVPVTYFLDENATVLPGISMHVAGNSAGGNMAQKIMPGAVLNEPTEPYNTKIAEIEGRLKVCEAEKAGLEKIIVMKDKFIDLLEKNQPK